MLTHSLRFSGLVLALCAAVALAQTPPEPQLPTDPPKVEKPQREGRPRPMSRGASAQVQLEVLTRQLQLDDQQQSEIKKLLDAQQKLIRDVREQNKRTPEDVEAWRVLKEEMDAAAKAGDKVKMEELRLKSQEMHKARRERIAPALKQLEQAEQTLHDDVAKLLKPEQAEKFETVWRERKLARGQRSGPLRNPRALKAIVEKLPDLTDDQKKQVNGLFEEFQKSLQERGKTEPGQSGDAPSDRETRQKLYRERQEKLFNDVIALLTPEQKAKVEEDLKGKNRRPEREPRGEKPSSPDENGGRPVAPTDRG